MFLAPKMKIIPSFPKYIEQHLALLFNMYTLYNFFLVVKVWISAFKRKIQNEASSKLKKRIYALLWAPLEFFLANKPRTTVDILKISTANKLNSG
jgi:hypothetical protein